MVEQEMNSDPAFITQVETGAWRNVNTLFRALTDLRADR